MSWTVTDPLPLKSVAGTTFHPVIRGRTPGQGRCSGIGETQLCSGGNSLPYSLLLGLSVAAVHN